MSGLELAGCVLGVFPLVLSALEGYENGFSLMKDWWKFKAEFKDFTHEIELQHALFQENLEYLLGSIIDDQSEMNRLIEDAFGEEWKKADLEERLQERLPKTYNLYVKTVTDLKAAVVKLQGKLNMEEGDHLDPDSINWKKEYKKIQFTLQRKKRDLLIAKIEKNNKTLQTILGSSERLEPARKARKKTFTTAFNKIQEQALHLHSVISKSWNCACPSAHGANLMLEKRVDPPKDKPPPPTSPRPSTPRSPGFPTTDQGRFKMLFYYEANPFELPPSWTETEIVIEKVPTYTSGELSPPPTRPPPHRASSSPSKPIINEPPSPPPLQKESRTRSLFSSLRRPPSPNPSVKSSKSRKSVSFFNSSPPQSPPPPYSSSPYLSPSPQFTDSSSTLVECGPASPQLPPTSELVDLCHLLTCPPIHPSTIATPCKSHTLTFLPPTTPENTTLVSLETLLTTQPPPLSRRDRTTIASTLSHSLLQLATTPWLGEGWTKRDIFFLQTVDTKPKVLVETPYISRRFLSSLTSPPPAPACSDYEKPLVALAILLLELCFGRTLESRTDLLSKHSDNGIKNAYTDQLVARDWLNDVEGEAGVGYYLAVKRCLTGMIPGCERGLDLGCEEGWKGVWEGVVSGVERFGEGFR